MSIDISDLTAVVGDELELGLLSTRIAQTVGRANAPTVGAVHITCADEAQHRVIEKVQELIVEPHVTPMASGERTAFRLINLGGYHEMGALTIAENHWAGAHDAEAEAKLMLVRVDAHVGVDHDPSGAPLYGHFLRFGQTSVACGALAAILRGQAMPGGGGFMDRDVRARRILEAFGEHTRMFAAAICRAELSAADCLQEIEAMTPDTPTTWLVASTVTLNHPDRHSSMLTGVAAVATSGEITGAGLGTDPERYVIAHPGDIAQVRRS